MPTSHRPLPPDLLMALCRLQSASDVERALDDLLSPAERSAIAERWAIVRLLHQGASQRAVRDAVGCSIATVSRGAAQLQRGGEGFALLLERAGRP